MFTFFQDGDLGHYRCCGTVKRPRGVLFLLRSGTPGDSRSVHKYRVELAGAAATTEPISSRNREHFLPGTLLSIANMKNALLAARPQARAGGGHATSSYFRPSCAVRSIFHPPLPRSKPCRMAQEHSSLRTNPNRRRHLLPPQGGGPRAQLVPSRRALKTRKEAMRDISRWPGLKPSPAI